MATPQVAVVGGGPAGLIAAETLAREGARVALFDRMPSVGRKFLLAGRGGLNLTHSEAFESFVARYGVAADRLRPALESFPPAALRAWAEELGQDTFVGSSGRVFPRAWKASPLLRAWLERLEQLGVVFQARHRWTGFGPDGELRFEVPGAQTAACRPDATILALGGASWPRLGSDGNWTLVLQQAGVGICPLRPSNCALAVNWTEKFRTRFEGAPLKRVSLSFGALAIRGEAVVSRFGLEGGAVYALSGPIRDETERCGSALLRVDLRPDLSAAQLAAALSRPRAKQSSASFLRKAAGLPPVAIALLHEASGPVLPGEAPALADLIKGLPVRAVGVGGLDRAISTAGGIDLDDVDRRFMLKRLPGVFVAGEMLDWEAPTGGYLLQACFFTGVAAARGALAWLNERG